MLRACRRPEGCGGTVQRAQPSSRSPSKTSSAGPDSATCSLSSVGNIHRPCRRARPRASCSRSVSGQRRVAMLRPHAVPQSVSPLPRSCTRIRMRPIPSLTSGSYETTLTSARSPAERPGCMSGRPHRVRLRRRERPRRAGCRHRDPVPAVRREARVHAPAAHRRERPPAGGRST